MNSFPDQEIVIESILKGSQTAKDNFVFWCNNRLSLTDHTENFLTIHIAQEIAKIKNPPEIFIDAGVEDIIKCSIDNKDNYIEYMQKRFLSPGTFNITLDERFESTSVKDSISRVIISVHSGVINPKLEYTNECERICRMLDIDENEKTSLDYGVLAFSSPLSKDARKKLDIRIPKIIKAFDEIVKSHNNLKSTYKGGDISKTMDDEQWCVGCYIIEPKK